MRSISRFPAHLRGRSGVTLALVLLLLLGMATLVSAHPAPDAAAPAGSFFSLNGTLDPGDTINPTVPIGTNNRPFNFALTINGSGPVALTIADGGGTIIWDGAAENGETLWGTGTLTQGNNGLTLTNNGAGAATFDLVLYDLPAAPTTWAGNADPDGLNSQARVTFPSDGLYTFDLGVSGGRYQFLLDDEYVQKTAESTTSVTTFVSAGVHTLAVVQDTTQGAGWDVAISGPGAASDSLPYAKSGGDIGGVDNDFAEEWLPIHLDAATEINLALTLTGSAGDTLLLEVYDTANEAIILTLPAVYAGETVWATVDLPAGTSRVHLVAAGGNADPLSYDMTISALAGPAFTWSGVADPAGLNSHARLTFADSGLYTFDLGVDAGRYQFLVDDDYVRKTAETNTTFTAFIPAGTHDFTIDQDTTAGAAWEIAVSTVGADDDTLPVAKSGGELGGAGNDFAEEWLPVTLPAGETANLSLTATGNATDTLVLEVYNSGSTTPDFTLDGVLGSETLWANFPLSAGTNRLHLMAEGGNADPLSYDLALSAVPTDSANWTGRSLDAGLNSQFMVNFSETGTYRFDVDATDGFVNLTLDDFVNGPTLNALSNSYEITVPAGPHVIYTEQDLAFPASDWTASVTPVVASAEFFTFTGTLDPGMTIAPEYTLDAASRDFNVALSVDGSGPVDLTIRDGSSALVWDGSGLDGETLWGTGTLTQGTNTMTLTNNGAAPADVTLVLYELPAAPTTWSGVADPAGLNSHARVTFADSGLYTFAFTATSGRFQFLLGNDFVQKTVEADTTLTAYVPAGTHDLVITQDTGAGAGWSVDVSAVGAANDNLPYAKAGGDVGGAGNDFAEEWLPVNLAAATQLNLRTTLTGTMGDNLALAVYDDNQTQVMTTTVYAGETTWATADLPAGTSRIHLLADGSNADPLSYDLVLDGIPGAPYTWDGNADPAGVNSHIRLDFPTAGLYTFDLGVDAGRYQFLLDDQYLQKTAESDTSITAYVPAGTHDLTVDQDTGTGADWDVTISTVGAANDTLPTAKTGGDIGGAGNDFTEAWLPINLDTATVANVELTLTGDAADALTLEVVDSGDNVLLALDPVFGTERTWATVDLPAGSARLHLVAAGANANPLAYDVTLRPIPTPAYVWEGHSLAAGLNAQIRLSTPISGLYHVAVYMPQGFTTLFVDSMPPTQTVALDAPTDFFYEFDVPLDAGTHTLVSDQDDGFPETSWVVTTTLVTADAPQITAVDPVSVTDVATTTVTVTGFNFMPGATATLDDGANTYPLAVTVLSASELEVMVPAGLPLGPYDLVVTNPDGQSATLSDGLTIYHPVYELYLPVIHNE